MRPIKFRAYLKDSFYLGRDEEIPKSGRIYNVGYLEFDSENVSQVQILDDEDCLYEDFALIRDVELMQYTGVLDENEKEIYEGEIVLYEYQNFAVKWFRGRYILTEYPNSRRDGFCDLHALRYFDLKIIGNIYENPELLE